MYRVRSYSPFPSTFGGVLRVYDRSGGARHKQPWSGSLTGYIGDVVDLFRKSVGPCFDLRTERQIRTGSLKIERDHLETEGGPVCINWGTQGRVHRGGYHVYV